MAKTRKTAYREAAEPIKVVSRLQESMTGVGGRNRGIQRQIISKNPNLVSKIIQHFIFAIDSHSKLAICQPWSEYFFAASFPSFK